MLRSRRRRIRQRAAPEAVEPVHVARFEGVAEARRFVVSDDLYADQTPLRADRDQQLDRPAIAVRRDRANDRGDRSAVLDPEFADRIVPGGNGVFRPTVVSDGRIVGTWRWTGRGTGRTATATPFTAWADDVAAEIARLAAALP